MEDPRKHDNKKNTKTLPVAVNIGAGAGTFGIGGIVLFGGALVTATIVSALAFKTKRQRRSSSENIKKSRSPSLETQTVDASNQSEFMMNSNKDFSADFSPLELEKPSSDEVTSMQEIQTKNIQNLTPDEKHNHGIDNDEQVDSGYTNEDIIFSVVGEDQENTSSYVDSVFENEDLDSYEKISLACEEQVVMATQIELGFPSTEEDLCGEILERDDGGEEQKFSMLTDDENKSLISNEAVTSIEEYESIDVGVKVPQDQVPLGDDVADEETDFMNEEAACVNQVSQVQFLEEEKEKEEVGHDEMIMGNCEEDLIDETGYADEIFSELVMEEDTRCVHQNKVQNCPQVQFLDEIILENCEGDLSYKTSPANQVMKEEAIEEACDDLVNMVEMIDHEVSPDAQEMQVNQVCETFVTACVMNSLKEDVNDETTVKEDNPPMELMNKQDLTIEDELCNKDEKDNMGEMPDVQFIEVAKVGDQTVVREDNPSIELMNEEEKAVQVEVDMITEDELVNKGENKEDEIPHVQSIEEDAISSGELQDSSMQEEMTPEANISNQKIEENMKENQTILGKKTE